jgi:endonuclease YncB( thermonuclease family)
MEALKHKLTALKNDDISDYSLNGIKTWGKIVDMYDGDTCRIILVHNDILQKFACRLVGVDTPEMKPSLTKEHRDQEIINAHKCRNRLLQLVTNCSVPSLDLMMKKPECKKILDTNTKLIMVKCGEFDKYGRLLVTLFPDEHDKVSANQQLVIENYAKSYDGGKKDVFTY